uniref:LOB domain-containing protein 15-like n=1 Tax=Eucalyptus grandis TaxID=71139 RepID=A0A286R6G0_EUCGR|nr:LOB domain-containing protein 15-like [Eucalyptus grandis]
MDDNGSGSLSTTAPCAACKLLERRCAQNCPFSLYFSPQETHKFKLFHEVFDASNFFKILMINPSQKAEAANSLAYEASLRDRDPVHASMGVISALQGHIQSARAELNAVRAQMSKYRDQAGIVPPPNDGLLLPNIAASTVAHVAVKTASSPSKLAILFLLLLFHALMAKPSVQN